MWLRTFEACCFSTYFHFLHYSDDDKYVFGVCTFLLKIRHHVFEVNIISQQWFLDFIKYEIATFICILLKNNGFIMQQFAIQIYEKQMK